MVQPMHHKKAGLGGDRLVQKGVYHEHEEL